MLLARDSFYFLFLPFLLRLLPEPRLPDCPFPALDVNELLRGDVLPFVQGCYPQLCLAGATNLFLCSDWLTVNRLNSSTIGAECRRNPVGTRQAPHREIGPV